jgi:hypothetical protein
MSYDEDYHHQVHHHFLSHALMNHSIIKKWGEHLSRKSLLSSQSMYPLIPGCHKTIAHSAGISRTGDIQMGHQNNPDIFFALRLDEIRI